jgi:hypothetical protein
MSSKTIGKKVRFLGKKKKVEYLYIAEKNRIIIKATQEVAPCVVVMLTL